MLLILDLDETLIHGAEHPLERPPDFRVGPFHIYARPFLKEFLLGASEMFQLAVWSSSTADYAGAISSAILPEGLTWEFAWTREHCVPRTNFECMETQYLKDLKKVKRKGFALERVLVVDDTSHKLARNYGNAIYVAPFEGDPGDRELHWLLDYLTTLQHVPNVRVEKRGWRNKVQPRDQRM